MSGCCKLKNGHDAVELHENSTKSRFKHRGSREMRPTNCEIINTLRNYNVTRRRYYDARDLRLFLVKRSLVSLQAIRTSTVTPLSVRKSPIDVVTRISVSMDRKTRSNLRNEFIQRIVEACRIFCSSACNIYQLISLLIKLPR